MSNFSAKFRDSPIDYFKQKINAASTKILLLEGLNTMVRGRRILLTVTVLVFAVLMSGQEVFAGRWVLGGPGSGIYTYINLFGTNNGGVCEITNWTLLKEDGDQETFQIPDGKMLVVQDIGFSVTNLGMLKGSPAVGLAIKISDSSQVLTTPYHYFNRAAVNENNAAGDNENMIAGFTTTRPFSARVVQIEDWGTVTGLLFVRIKGILIDAP